MTILTGLVSSWPSRRWWERLSQPVVELAPDHALFVLRRSDCALRQVELSAGESRTLALQGDEMGLVLRRDFGVRLGVPCEFGGSVAGHIEAEVRLRVLSGGAEWPRLLPSEEPSAAAAGDALPERVLAGLIARLFAADLARVFLDQPYAGLPLRLHDPALVGEAEAAVRTALARPAEEGILALRSVELLAVESPEEEELRRLGRTLRFKKMKAEAEAATAKIGAGAQEVRWRLFEPSDLQADGAQPPRLRQESSDRHTALASGHHVQVLVQPAEPSHVYALSLGPYWTGAGGEVEYRWMCLFGNGGTSDLLQRPLRAAGNRLAGGELLVFPGDVGASELFQHYLTLDSAPGTEFLIAALTPQPLPDEALSRALPLPALPTMEPAFPDRLEAELRNRFGTESRLHIFRFSHS